MENENPLSWANFDYSALRMQILKDNNDYYLCDDNNFFYLEDFITIRSGGRVWYEEETIYLNSYYEDLTGYELGSYYDLISVERIFEYRNKYTNYLTATPQFIEKYKAWSREIRIRNIFDEIC